MVKYVVDSSALINAKQYYPVRNLKDFWDKIHEMNSDGKLFIIKKVKEELKRGFDFLSTDFFEDKVISNEEIAEVINKFEVIVNSLGNGYQVGFQRWLKDADPYVIAFAMHLSESVEEDVIVLHGEKENKAQIRIPMVCKKVNVKYGFVDEIIRLEDLQFRLA